MKDTKNIKKRIARRKRDRKKLEKMYAKEALSLASSKENS
jgi:hypothetical protein